MGEAHGRKWSRTGVDNWTASGQTAAAFAAPLGVDPESLSWWRGHLRREGASRQRPAARFIEVEVQHPTPVAALKPPPARAHPSQAVQPQGLVARVGAVRFELLVGTDTGYLAALVCSGRQGGVPMLMLPPGTRIYLCTEPCDMCPGLDGLVAESKRRCHSDPFAGSLFIFVDKRKHHIRC